MPLEAAPSPLRTSEGIPGSAGADILSRRLRPRPHANWLSNRMFKSYDDIVDHCRFAGNTFMDQSSKIFSIGLRRWLMGYDFSSLPFQLRRTAS
jgi:hypothetical protein